MVCDTNAAWRAGGASGRRSDAPGSRWRAGRGSAAGAAPSAAHTAGCEVPLEPQPDAKVHCTLTALSCADNTCSVAVSSLATAGITYVLPADAVTLMPHDLLPRFCKATRSPQVQAAVQFIAGQCIINLFVFVRPMTFKQVLTPALRKSQNFIAAVRFRPGLQHATQFKQLSC